MLFFFNFFVVLLLFLFFLYLLLSFREEKGPCGKEILDQSWWESPLVTLLKSKEKTTFHSLKRMISAMIVSGLGNINDSVSLQGCGGGNCNLLCYAKDEALAEFLIDLGIDMDRGMDWFKWTNMDQEEVEKMKIQAWKYRSYTNQKYINALKGSSPEELLETIQKGGNPRLLERQRHFRESLRILNLDEAKSDQCLNILLRFHPCVVVAYMFLSKLLPVEIIQKIIKLCRFDRKLEIIRTISSKITKEGNLSLLRVLLSYGLVDHQGAISNIIHYSKKRSDELNIACLSELFNSGIPASKCVRYFFNSPGWHFISKELFSIVFELYKPLILEDRDDLARKLSPRSMLVTYLKDCQGVFNLKVSDKFVSYFKDDPVPFPEDFVMELKKRLNDRGKDTFSKRYGIVFTKKH